MHHRDKRESGTSYASVKQSYCCT